MELPLSWSQFGDPVGGVLAYALQGVDQVGLDIDAVKPTSHNQALDNADLFGTQFGPTKVPIFALMHVRP